MNLFTSTNIAKNLFLLLFALQGVTSCAFESKKFNITDGSAYICQNIKSSDMLIQLVYSRTSPELVSAIVNAPTKRIDKVLTWTFLKSNQIGSAIEYSYSNTNISSTTLTISPSRARINIAGTSGYLEFDNCTMIEKETKSPLASDKGDYERLNSIKKNGIDGWGYAQDVFTGDGYSYLLLNPSKPSHFRHIKYINCLPDPKFMTKLGWDKICKGRPNYYQKIISDEILSASIIYKYLVDRESKSEYKDTSEVTSKLSKEGWKNFRLYYVPDICSGKEMASVRDFYNSSYEGYLRRVTTCKSMVVKDLKLNSYKAEIEYYESGMYQGD